MRGDVSNTALIFSLLEDTVDINTLEEACLACRNATLNETDFRSSSL